MIRLENFLKTSWQDVLKTYPSKHSFWWRCLEVVFRLLLQKTSSRRFRDVLIKTNMFAVTLRLQKTSSRRLGQDQYTRLGHMSSIRFQDVLKASTEAYLEHGRTSTMAFFCGNTLLFRFFKNFHGIDKKTSVSESLFSIKLNSVDLQLH